MKRKKKGFYIYDQLSPDWSVQSTGRRAQDRENLDKIGPKIPRTQTKARPAPANQKVR